MAHDSKNVFLTGGAQGLGRAYVERFLEEGANVFFGDVNKELGEATLSDLRKKFGEGRVAFFPFDVTDSSKFKDAFSQAVTKFGQVDVMVNNAGILNESRWEQSILINFTATIQGTKLAVEHMRKDTGGKGGRIVNISSIMGLDMHFSQPVYCGTKHAVRAFTTSTAMTPGLHSHMGIEVALLCPDIVHTDLITKLDDSRIHGLSKITGVIELRKMPMQTVVDGLFSLLHKEDINSAILLVTKNNMSFQKMEKKDLGSDWPIPQ